MMRPARKKKPVERPDMITSDKAIQKALKNQITQNRLSAMSEEKRKKLEAKQERAAQKQEQGITSSKKSKDGPMIPWIPFTLKGKTLILSPPLRSIGHGGIEYDATWIAPATKVPGVKVSKSGSINGIPHAVYTGGAYIVNNTKPVGSKNTNLYVTTRPLTHVNNNSTTSKLVRNRLQGPDVSQLSMLIRNRKGKIAEAMDLYNYKLLGDRYSVAQTEELNKDGNYIIKPYSISFAKLIQNFSWAEDPTEKKAIKDVMIKERDDYLPYYFEKGVLYTGDRPLFLYCLKKGIPCIIEIKGGFVYSESVEKDKKKFEAFAKKKVKGFEDKIRLLVLECFQSPSDSKINVFDCLHDFGKERSYLGIDRVKEDLREIYENDQQDVKDFIGKFEIQADITNSENFITKFLEDGGLTKLNAEQLYNLFNGGKLVDSCIIYDAGTQIPISVYGRIAATTQRITNGFYGAPARRRLQYFGTRPATNLPRFDLPNLPNNINSPNNKN